MKGGKDEEKIMGPMFPRLHVNDTEKGGPRAPPRNKMALYEQLSIPSQRFNSGSQLLTNNSSLAPTASLNQGAGRERTVFSPFRIPPPASAHSADNLHSHSTEGLNSKTRTQTSEQQKSMKVANYQMSNSLMHLPPAPESASFNPNDPVNSKNLYTSKLGDDDDFKVPTFASSRNPKKDQTVDREKFTPHSPTRLGQTTSTPVDNMPKIVASTCSSSTHHNTRDKHLKRTNTTDLRSRQHSWDHSEENQLDSVTSKDCAGNATSCPLIREMVAEPSFHAYETPIQEHDNPMDNLGEHDNNMRLHHKYRMEFLQNTTPSDAILPEQVGLTEKGNVILVRNETCSRASIRNDHTSPNEPCEDEANEVLQVEDVDRHDDVSETSMVDSITVLDISPDDVVGVIGQKHFWKARRAIVNQQRLFAVQVFELHRLMKVQKLIAGSPHLLLDDTYLSKPAIKVAPIKNLSEYGLNSSQQIVKQKNESQKQSQSTECAAENVVRKPLPSPSDGVNNALGNHHSSYGPYAGNHPAAPAPVAPDNKAGWYFHPPPGNQWLIPVMSPSEGLVYKPYAGPCPPSAGFMAPMYGGCEPMNMTPLEGGFPGSPYGIPPSHPQGIGALPGAPQTYFSPYGMPIMNPLMSSSAVEQVNQHQLHPLAGAQSLGHPGQLSTGDANFKMHSRNSCNVSNQRSEAISTFKFQASKGSEIQGSTASSPCEKAQGKGAGYASEGGDALSLFPMSPAIQARDQTPQTRSSEQQHTRVIKVVPHNPRSATESAARIFQSIQEERQQHD